MPTQICDIKPIKIVCAFSSVDDAEDFKAFAMANPFFSDSYVSKSWSTYENDISLITHADIGVAVGNAIDEVKNAADMVVKSAFEYAIKDLIEIIEKKL